MLRRTLPLSLTSALVFALASAEAGAAITLDFNSLPSTQGWIYNGQYTSAPNESDVFSVSGGVLYQNSLGVTSSAPSSNRYNLFNALTPGQDYMLEVKAQLDVEQYYDTNNHWAFGAGFFDGTGHAYGFSLGNAGVLTDWAYYTGVDTHVAHTYRLVSDASTGTAKLWIDGTFIGGGSVGNYGSCTPLGSYCNSVYLGDGTSGPNASGAYYSFNMAPVPEPETYALMLAGLGLVGFASRRRLGGK
jgi:hypothetical protein